MHIDALGRRWAPLRFAGDHIEIRVHAALLWPNAGIQPPRSVGSSLALTRNPWATHRFSLGIAVFGIAQLQDLLETLSHSGTASLLSALCTDVIDDLIFSVAGEAYQSREDNGMHSGATWLYHAEEPLVNPSVSRFNRLATTDLTCFHCGRAISAARFAPHLERCMIFGRSSLLPLGSHPPSPTPARSRDDFLVPPLSARSASRHGPEAHPREVAPVERESPIPLPDGSPSTAMPAPAPPPVSASQSPPRPPPEIRPPLAGLPPPERPLGRGRKRVLADELEDTALPAVPPPPAPAVAEAPSELLEEPWSPILPDLGAQTSPPPGAHAGPPGDAEEEAATGTEPSPEEDDDDDDASGHSRKPHRRTGGKQRRRVAAKRPVCAARRRSHRSEPPASTGGLQVPPPGPTPTDLSVPVGAPAAVPQLSRQVRKGLTQFPNIEQLVSTFPPSAPPRTMHELLGALFTQFCGVVSEGTGKMCANNLRCKYHSKAQQSATRTRYLALHEEDPNLMHRLVGIQKFSLSAFRLSPAVLRFSLGAV
ncbi:hypothetical protein PAPYR_11217 [Paratrimastix pyriformis]|uniref:SCA7 domain-containing protein n=1 Tax=Paratrimastix pyriformis TaxID=342808 RepID=A0ABQ8U627_9EUKA|nr:hypothetical protein PAPYR_11217 [Paratrimastix pyriformis]